MRSLRLLAVVAGALALVAACNDADRASSGERGTPIKRGQGKADGSNSCAGHCGAMAPAGCYCDDACLQHGDCCHDKAAVCDGTPASCEGHCGGRSPAGCYCDDACDVWGDCCEDKQQVCGGGGDSCTGNAECGSGSYCHFAEGACLGLSTEILTGQCKPRPEACYEILAPVCGCDGQTYDNDCFAYAAGTSVAEQGACQKTCGPIPDGQCEQGQVCDIGSCAIGATGSCVDRPDGCREHYEPVCGCDGQTYGNDCHRLVAGVAKEHDGECSIPCYIGGCSGEVCSPFDGINTPCVALPWHTCVNLSECGNYGPTGGCGWKQTPEYVACMQQHGETP